MIVVLILIFSLVALAAAGFVVLPLLRASKGSQDSPKSRAWLALGAGLATMALGLGAYAFLGEPQIALADLTGPSRTDYRALIASLARRMPQRPGDIEGWTLLGRGYLALGNPAQAEKAFARAVDAAKTSQGGAPPELLSDYGEAMAEAAGQVTKEAEAVFREALSEDPRDLVSRYYVGLALASRGDKAGALQLWEGVLADAPPDTPWRGALVDQMAALKAESGGAPPNPAVMVARLAQDLENNPDNLNGWLMLIRSYSSLGDRPKAVAALAKARSVFANQADAQTQLDNSAEQNGLK